MKVKLHLTKSNIHSLYVSKGLISESVSKRSISIKKLPYYNHWKINVANFDGYYDFVVVAGYGDVGLFSCVYDDEGFWRSEFVCRVTVDELKRFGFIKEV